MALQYVGRCRGLRKEAWGGEHEVIVVFRVMFQLLLFLPLSRHAEGVNEKMFF